jgi:hypothetical protein
LTTPGNFPQAIFITAITFPGEKPPFNISLYENDCSSTLSRLPPRRHLSLDLSIDLVTAEILLHAPSEHFCVVAMIADTVPVIPEMPNDGLLAWETVIM